MADDEGTGFDCPMCGEIMRPAITMLPLGNHTYKLVRRGEQYCQACNYIKPTSTQNEEMETQDDGERHSEPRPKSATNKRPKTRPEPEVHQSGVEASG